MRSTYCAGKLAFVLVLSVGCAQQANEAGTGRAEGGDQAASQKLAGNSSQPAISGEPADAVASQVEVRQTALTLDDRTVMGQPLPEAVKETWAKQLRKLAAENPLLIRVVADRAEAQWLLQVAALERTDILYLSPVQPDGSEPDDESLRMSPPGDAAIDWLKGELEQAARNETLMAILTEPALNEQPAEEQPAEEATSQSDPSVDPLAGTLVNLEDEPRTEAARSSPEVDAEARTAEMKRQRTAMEQLRQQYESQRFEAAGAKAGEILFHHGPAEDLKAEIVKEQSGVYHTANRTQAVLGAYGKMVAGSRLRHHLARFEHRGLVERLDRVRRFTTVARMGHGAGKDFVSLVGTRQAWQIVDLTAQISGGRRHEVAFEIVGLRLDQNDVIKALNADADALSYFAYLREQNETACLVLENLVFASYSAATDTNLDVGGKAKTILTSDGAAARADSRRSSFTQFASPVIRCYQPYEVKLDGRQVVELAYIDP